MAETFPDTGFEITALCDRNPQRIVEAEAALRQSYARHDVEIAPHPYENGLDLIDDPTVDLIVITSITDTHRQFAVPALHTGKKVYFDKPLAHNAEDAVAIVEAEAESRNPLIIGFTRRYESPWLRAFDLVQDGTIGDLRMLQVRDVIPYHSDG